MPRLAVLGQPVSHSRSPAMQNAALAELGLASRWSYEAIEVAPENFEALVRSLAADVFAGVNVTVPHKLAALGVADGASAAARAIGAANTLSFDDGRIAAENTDAIGLLGALGEEPAGRRALLMGAGGSARACAFALREGGAEVATWNRTHERAEALAREFGLSVAELGPDGFVALEEFDFVVNATTVGLGAANPASQASVRDAPRLKPLPLDADAITEEHVVVDLVYGSHATPLAEIAAGRGARVIDGLDVLVHQGAASLRIWTGAEPPIQTMRRAARAEQPNR
jgi:shikimate dehydrogenase